MASGAVVRSSPCSGWWSHVWSHVCLAGPRTRPAWCSPRSRQCIGIRNVMLQLYSPRGASRIVCDGSSVLSSA